ncbi:MAG: hypothetical protein ACRDRR_13890 [Pseudonocardiaceae bacterium]
MTYDRRGFSRSSLDGPQDYDHRLETDALARHAQRMLLLAGEDSRGYPAYQVNVELGQVLGRAIIETPGGHAAVGIHPVEFGRTLHHALSTRGADDPRLESDGIQVRR